MNKALESPSASQVGILLSEVEPTEVEWLWRNRIPLGKVTILDGDPGLGKSLLTLEITARVSNGESLPGDDGSVSAGAVILTSEDGLGDTVRPRLEAAGANLQRILALKYTQDREGEVTVSQITDELPNVEAAIQRVEAKLVVIDPLMAYLPEKTNSFRDQEIRRALAPLAAMADRNGVAILCIRHLNKSVMVGNSLYRGGGSIGIIGAARSGMLVSRDPDNPEQCVLAMTKANLGPPMPSLAYRIGVNEDGRPRIKWLGESRHNATSLLALPAGEREPKALEEAQEFLRQALADGPHKETDLSEGAKGREISGATLRRAKESLQIKSKKVGIGKDGHWVWTLPKVSENTASENMSTLEDVSPFKDAHLGEEGMSTLVPHVYGSPDCPSIPDMK